MLPVELYSVKQIRALEKQAISGEGIAEEALMGRAGKAAFDDLIESVSQITSMAVFCGSGNNGGDGYIVARLAKKQGIEVTIFTIGDPQGSSPATRNARQACLDASVEILDYQANTEIDTDVVVDALLGIGLNKSLQGLVANAVKDINRSNAFVLSLDVPTGLDADRGVVMGDCVAADMTVTFIGVKQGMLTAEGVDHCGIIQCSDLDLGSTLETVAINAMRVDACDLDDLLPPRRRATHKGHFGHVLIVGGDAGMAGAVGLSAEAALRSGAGLVSLATREKHCMALTGARPEIMCHGVENEEDLAPLLSQASVCVVGPGLGQSAWGLMMFESVIRSSLPLVIDASALQLLSKMNVHSDRWVLTPHPGEAAQLLNTTTAQIQSDRFKSACELQRRYGGVIILKGAGSLIQAADSFPYLCDQGNPGMATAGMGDVLSGVLGALLAQHLTPLNAAIAAVVAHANAGDWAATDGGQRGVIASDLFPYIRRSLNPSDKKLIDDESSEWL